MIRRRSLSAVRFVACLTLALTGAAAQDASPRKPNIVVLFADDAGYVDFGFQPDAAKDVGPLTPNIDRIAAAGARLSNAYMSGCVCSPSRAGLMTGRYQQRFGHELNIPPGYMGGGLPLEERTVADRLRDLGYATALVGKWHLGYPDDYHPNRRGFDWFYGLLQGSRGYFPLDDPSPHRVIQENGEPTPEEGYVTDRFGRAAARFIGKNKERPFFLFVSFTAPHGPLQAKPEDLAKLGNIGRDRRRRYAGLVKALDDNVGIVLQALAEHGLENDTLVIFTNDNGGQTRTGARNLPLRGRKGQLWEGGIRVPMAVRWPGRIAPGTVIDDPVIALDLLPTFVTAAGGSLDPEWKLDGIDLLPRLLGKVDSVPERTLFWRSLGREGPIAARRGPWKLLVERAGDDEQARLFHLNADLGEANDLAAAQPKRVDELRAAIAAWEAELVEPLFGGGR